MTRDYRLPAQVLVGRLQSGRSQTERGAASATRKHDHLLLRQSPAMASRRSDFGKDTGLQARMLLTMFLLGLVYAVFVGVLFAAGAGASVIVVVAVVLLMLQLFTSDKLAMATMGVKEVSPAEEPELHGIIERLCVQADLPKPRVCVMETSMPNAFAMGRTQKSTTVCATRGILGLLSAAELEGVMAHELTHVINRDVMVMTLASFFATLASTIAQFALFFGGGYGNREEEEDIMIVVFVSVAVYAVSFLLLRALSRYREFAADRGSAVLTGRPSALASALLKISGTMEQIPAQDLRKAEGMSAFFIVPARAKKSLMNIFADHPPLEQRLAALERLEAQLQGTA
jgi:heat shock protein HtpX